MNITEQSWDTCKIVISWLHKTHFHHQHTSDNWGGQLKLTVHLRELSVFVGQGLHSIPKDLLDKSLFAVVVEVQLGHLEGVAFAFPATAVRRCRTRIRLQGRVNQ